MQCKKNSYGLETSDRKAICAVILAGGAARRMGGVDKGWVAFENSTLVETVVRTIKPQVGKVVISANRNLERYRSLGFEVVTDKMEGYRGPLVGIASAMTAVDSEFYVTAPCDSPFVPKDYVRKLYRAFEEDSQIKCAAVVSHGYKQPVFMMVRKETLASIEDYLAAGENRVRGWLESMQAKWVDFEDLRAFENFNTPEDLQKSVADRAK